MKLFLFNIDDYIGNDNTDFMHYGSIVIMHETLELAIKEILIPEFYHELFDLSKSLFNPDDNIREEDFPEIDINLQSGKIELPYYNSPEIAAYIIYLKSQTPPADSQVITFIGEWDILNKEETKPKLVNWKWRQ